MIPRISIITINKNNASGLQLTIESVIRQSASIEFIVIDGASEDESVSLLESHDPRISNWISEPDLGIYDAMNKGILLSHGKYCLFLNSGDILASDDVIEKSLPFLKGHPIVYGNLLLSNNSHLPPTLMRYPPPRALISRPYSSFGLPHPCTFISRNLLTKLNGYRTDFRISSDWALFLDIVYKYNIPIRHINLAISIFDITGISSRPENVVIQNAEKKLHIQQNYPMPWLFYQLKAYVWHLFSIRRYLHDCE